MKRTQGLLLALALCVVASGCDDETELTRGPTTATGTGAGSGGGSGGLGPMGGSGGSTATGTGTAQGGSSVGGGAGTGGGNAGAAGGGLPNEPGTITIEVSGRSNDDGKRLIVSVLTPTGTTPLGGICETIGGGSASGVVSQLTGNDNCDLGSAVTFDPDTYPIFAGIYPSGSPSPEVCASRSVTVGGAVTVQLTSFYDCN